MYRELAEWQAFMQRPVHPSCGRVNTLWTGAYLSGRFKRFLFNSYVSRSPLRRTAQSALHIMLLSYHNMCIFHECQRDMTSVKHNVLEISIFVKSKMKEKLGV